MRRVFSLVVIGLLTAAGWLALTEEASAQRGRGRGGWYGGGGGYGPGYYNRGYYGSGYGYGYPGYGYPGVTFGGRNWGVTIPFDGGYGRGYYDSPYYSSRPYYYGGYSQPYYTEGGYEEASPQNSAQIEVIVPDANAEVRFNGQPTRERGSRRIFTTAPLEPGYSYSYEVDAQWQRDGTPQIDTRTVQLKPGGRVVVDFTRQQASTQQRPDSAETQEQIQPRQPLRQPQQPQPQKERPQRPPQTPEDAPPIP
jgi:uncharacterized protein (TIGR03000 family)